jgi:hypothetical protein
MYMTRSQRGIGLIFVADYEFSLHNVYNLVSLLRVEQLGMGVNNSYSEHQNSLRKTVESKKKARISIAIDRDFIAWIDQMIKAGVFANRSHAIHRALIKLKEDVTS